MPDTLITLAWVIAGLLLICSLILLRIGGRLARIERMIGEKAKPRQKLEQPDVKSQGGAFGKFLSEHPDLIMLPKSEQFSAFRKWRKEQGLNWEGR